MRAERPPACRAAALALLLLSVACKDSAPPAGGELPGPAADENVPERVPHPDLAAADPAVRERLDSERERLEELLEAAPAADVLAAGWGTMGRLYQAHDFIAPAAGCYRNAARLAPSEPTWHYYLGAVYQHQGDFDRAAEELGRALELRPADAATLRRLGDVERARRRPEQAERRYRQAVAEEPACHAARFGLAEILRERGELEAATALYREILAADPRALQVHYPLAQTLLRLGRRDEAEDHLARSTARDPRVGGGLATCPDPLDDELQLLMTGAPIHLARGRLAAAAGDVEGEIAEYRRAVELAPDLPIALQNLAWALSRRGDPERGDHEEALELYAEAVRLEPGSADLRHDLSLLLTVVGRPREAVEQLRAALAIQPDHAGARLALARALQQQGQAVEALALYDRILADDPSHEAARLQRALCLVQLGRRQEAVVAFGELLDRQPPEDPVERLRLAMVIGRLGDSERAVRHLEAVLLLDADRQVHLQAHGALAALFAERGDAERAARHREAARDLAARKP